jgi:hypothetical protein
MEEKAFPSKKWYSDVLETPWLKRQVETHIVFGPISRHVSFAWLVLCSPIAAALYFFLSADKPVNLNTYRIFEILFILTVPILLFRFTRFQQAVIGWIVIKVSFGLIAFLFMTVASLISLMKGQSDALPNLLLGFIWLPVFEFIPSVTPRQKYLTLARIILTIPVVYLGLQSGHWHW